MTIKLFKFTCFVCSPLVSIPFVRASRSDALFSIRIDHMRLCVPALALAYRNGTDQLCDKQLKAAKSLSFSIRRARRRRAMTTNDTMKADKAAPNRFCSFTETTNAHTHPPRTIDSLLPGSDIGNSKSKQRTNDKKWFTVY